MPARDYSIPQPTRPSFTRASLEAPAEQHRATAFHRGTRMQSYTDFDPELDFNPKHSLVHCCMEFEQDDPAECSVSCY